MICPCSAAGVSSVPSLPSSFDPKLHKTVGYVSIEPNLLKGVEISLDPKEALGLPITGSFDTSFDEKMRKKDEKTSLDKKIQKLALEVAGTPDSPLTESGPLTDTGISSLDITGDRLRTRKLPLDIPEQTDTEYEYSEFSPSPIGHDLPPLSPIPSESAGSPKNLSIEPDLTTADINNQMKSVHEAGVCDEKLSPILFQDTKATSPMGVKGTKELLRSTKDASSSPPQHTTQSASTSPPQRGDLDPSAASTAVTSPCDSQVSKDTKDQSS